MPPCFKQLIIFGEPEEHKYDKLNSFSWMNCCQKVYLPVYSHIVKENLTGS